MKMNTHIYNKQFTGNNSDSNDIVQNHSELLDNDDNNDPTDNEWIEGVALEESEFMNTNEIDDVDKVIVRWDKDNDFSLLHHEYDDDFSIEMIDKKYKDVIKSERTIFRR